MLKPIIESLELSFDYLNTKLFNNELPQAVITIQSKGNTKSLGWCTCNAIWYNTSNEEETFYEINFSAEYIGSNFENIMETMIHEMVHLWNITHGIKDCNKQQYHNKHFKAKAEEVGLIVEKCKYGWSQTSLSDELKELIETIPIAKDIFTIQRFEKPVKKSIERVKKVKMICPSCKAKCTVDEEINIICENCDCKFEVLNK